MISPNTKLIAIGGGKPEEVHTSLIERGLLMADSQHPNILVVPSSKSTQASFEKATAAAQLLYGVKLGKEYTTLHQQLPLTGEDDPSFDELQEKIENADFIHLIGGNTPHQSATWERLHLDTLLRNAIENGAVAVGASAGALAMFTQGMSNPNKKITPDEERDDYIVVDGELKLVDAVLCPHYHNPATEKMAARRDGFHKLLSDGKFMREPGLDLGIDTNAGLLVINGMFEVVRAVEGASVFKVIQEIDGSFRDIDVYNGGQLLPIAELRAA